MGVLRRGSFCALLTSSQSDGLEKRPKVSIRAVL